MEYIENLFKQKILLTSPLREDCDHREERKIKWSGIYKSNIIYNHNTIFSNIDDLLEQIKPYLYYLASKDVNREGDRYIFETELVVGLFWKIQTHDGGYRYKYIRLGGFVLNNIESSLNFDIFYPCDNVNHRDLRRPFEIHIDVFQEYNLQITDSEGSEYEMETEDETETESEMEEDEIEDELELDDEIEDVIEEDKTPIPVSKPFVSFQCVVCLSNKPNLIFINCLHCCVCLECEKRKPFNRCPSCRTDISIKINM